MSRAIYLVTGLLPFALFAACSGGTTVADPTASPSPVSEPAAAAGNQAPASETPAPEPESAPASAPAVEATGEASDDASTLDGIYTVAQAERGAGVYARICSECHDGAEDWTDPIFLQRWDGDSVFRFWYYIYERMPHGDPYTLSREQVTDVLTYILQLNELPPGGGELGTDDDSLDDYWLYWSANRASN